MTLSPQPTTFSSSNNAPDAAQMAFMQKMMILNNKSRGGINWFFWIAGLSILNSIIFALGANLTFTVGLGMTQLVDGFIHAGTQGSGQNAWVIIVIGVMVNLFIAGIFALFGFLGRKRNRGAIIAGLVLYLIDAILVLVFKDYFGFLFHGLAVYGIITGLRAMNQLQKLEKTGFVPS